MLTVPQEFHDYSRAPERRTDLIVRLDPLSWPTGINAHGTAHSLCMPIQWDKSPPHRLYATGEYNRTPLDGRALVNGWAGQVSPTPCPIRTACLPRTLSSSAVPAMAVRSAF